MSLSVEHQRLVRALVNHFQKNLGFTIIGAALPDYHEPPKQGDYIPDLLARDQNGTLQIGEAELGNEIYSEQTEKQFREFSNRVMTETHIPVPFHIVIYKQDYQKLFLRLMMLGLSTKVGNRIKIWTL